MQHLVSIEKIPALYLSIVLFITCLSTIYFTFCCIYKKRKQKKRNKHTSVLEEEWNEFPSDLRHPLARSKKVAPKEEDIVQQTVIPKLLNKGDICYMNAIIQALGSCKKLVRDLKEINEIYNTEKLKSFISLLNALNSSNAQGEFNAFFSDYGWANSGQQDSYEMLAYIINSVYNELKEIENVKNSQLNQNEFYNYWNLKALPLRICFSNEIRCNGDNCFSSNFQVDLALHLPLLDEHGSSVYQLETLICSLFNEQPVDGTCNICGGGQHIQTLLTNCPNTLCLHIQANKWDDVTNVMTKPNFELKYLFFLTLCDRLYQLVSVVEHFGSTSVGHYISFRKSHGNWFCANDGSVKNIGIPEDPSEFCRAPYVLFYEIVEDNENEVN